MSTGAAALHPQGAGRIAPGLAALRPLVSRLLDRTVALWMVTGAFVIVEPSPYEVMFLVTLAVALFSGFGLHKANNGLLALFALFIPFAMLAAFRVKYGDLTDAIIFQLVTAFLILTSYFVANYLADDPVRRMRMMVGPITFAAVASAMIGTLAYLGLMPAADFFTRFGRAKAFFNDPNVYGPFLCVPAAFAMMRILLGTTKQGIRAGMVFGILFVGVFVSFSRAAWGHFAATAAIVFVLAFFLEADGRAKARMLMLSIAGALMLMIALGGLLSVPAVQSLFEVRTASQNYDTGETGRFGRQGYAFDMALSNPLGIGPGQFYFYRIVEMPHNVYVNVFLAYGWGGGFIYYGLIVWTLWRAFSGLLRAGPERRLLIPLVAVFIPLLVESAIIDSDHWRHWYLIVGMIWGVTSVQRRKRTTPAERQAALV